MYSVLAVALAVLDLAWQITARRARRRGPASPERPTLFGVVNRAGGVLHTPATIFLVLTAVGFIFEPNGPTPNPGWNSEDHAWQQLGEGARLFSAGGLGVLYFATVLPFRPRNGWRSRLLYTPLLASVFGLLAGLLESDTSYYLAFGNDLTLGCLYYTIFVGWLLRLIEWIPASLGDSADGEDASAGAAATRLASPAPITEARHQWIGLACFTIFGATYGAAFTLPIFSVLWPLGALMLLVTPGAAFLSGRRALRIGRTYCAFRSAQKAASSLAPVAAS